MKVRNAAEIEENISSLVLLDIVPVEGFSYPRITDVSGNLADPQVLNRAVDAETASIFHVGQSAVRRIRWESDPAVQRIIGSWPGSWDMTRAHALGFKGDKDFDSIVQAYIADDLKN